MKELECDYIATGHYAQVFNVGRDGFAIQISEDRWKDQTYFLFNLQKEIIRQILFPVGHLSKLEVRQYAENRGLLVAKKKDSTGICFVGNQGYQNFLASRIQDTEVRSGVIRHSQTGKVLATHAGIHHFTVGQSKRLGFDHHEKLFVNKIESETSTVWVGDEADLYQTEMKVRDLNWLGEPDENHEIVVKIRSTHPGAVAKILLEQGDWKVKFQEPQRAITPGQAAVFYQQGRLMGGGWIL